jgi:ribosomal protein S12 methylthiotransferase
MKKMKVSIISLGCARNLVDSELVIGKVKQLGYVICDKPDKSDIIIINTCAFIEEAKKEAIDIILKAVRLKQQGSIKKIIVCGCLGQRYSERLKNQIPEIDAILGIDNFVTIEKAMKAINAGRDFVNINSPDIKYTHKQPRILMTPSHYAYIKIAEGCRNHCSYCAIYKIRGDVKSRSIESLVTEIKNITGKEKKSEINIIAQDTTSYGIDRYKNPALVRLLKRICGLNRAHWIRLLYTHPKSFTDELISTIAQESSICKYIDLPLQHINDRILSRMNRSISRKKIERLIKKIRREIPDVALRTSIIVGFPGESDAHFKELLDFIDYVQFERLGAFTYSREEGTPAYSFSQQLSEKVKSQRLDRLMRLQQEISKRVNRKFLGRILEVLIEEKVKGVSYLGRTQYDAPEVDGLVHVDSIRPLRQGEFVNVEITDSLEYDLLGHAVQARSSRKQPLKNRKEKL